MYVRAPERRLGDEIYVIPSSLLGRMLNRLQGLRFKAPKAEPLPPLIGSAFQLHHPVNQ